MILFWALNSDFHEMPFLSSATENNQTVWSDCNPISKYIFGLDFTLSWTKQTDCEMYMHYTVQLHSTLYHKDKISVS